MLSASQATYERPKSLALNGPERGRKITFNFSPSLKEVNDSYHSTSSVYLRAERTIIVPHNFNCQE